MRRMTLQQPRLVVGQAGAQRGDDFLQTGEREAQDVELPLHQNRPLRFSHPVLGEVQVVKQLSLVKDRRLGEFKYLGSPSPKTLH